MGAHDIAGEMREMERMLLRGLAGGGAPGPLLSGDLFRPPVDIFETADAVVIRMEIPGVRRGDVRVDFEEGTVVIRGRREDRSVRRRVAYHQMEIDYGVFERRISLCVPVKREEISAHYRDGFLEVRVPRGGRRGGRTGGGK